MANEKLQETVGKLRQKRDELKVKLNLGKMEARDAWEDVEKDFERLETKWKKAREQGGKEVDKMRDEIEELIDDVRDGFERVRKKA